MFGLKLSDGFGNVSETGKFCYKTPGLMPFWGRDGAPGGAPGSPPIAPKHPAGVAPREIDFLDTMPKTRSGKIMRRLLKARELGEPEGDISTLEDD